MTTLDDRLRPRAEAMIAKYGKVVLLQSLVQGDYDPATGTASSDYVNYEVTGVVTAPSKIMFDLTLAREGDTMLLLADDGLGITPKAGDTVDFQDGAAVWSVLSVQTTYSGDLPAIHSLLLRR